MVNLTKLLITKDRLASKPLSSMDRPATSPLSTMAPSKQLFIVELKQVLTGPTAYKD